jgi:hypothetical protein
LSSAFKFDIARFHKQCSLGPIKLLDPHVRFLSPDIATLVYHATEKPTCGTHTMSGETNISTVWVHRDSRWQMHLHTVRAAEVDCAPIPALGAVPMCSPL